MTGVLTQRTDRLLGNGQTKDGPGERFAGLRAARRQGRDWLLGEVAASGLQGRGGAGFPVLRKWNVALATDPPRVVLANGAEDEPGSLKDRHLMSARPDLVMDGLLVTAFALGAEYVILYVTAGCPEALAAMRKAADHAIREGNWSPDRIRVVEAPSQYVAGEDTAAIEFVEHGKAVPRSKPPYPAERGLAGAPTVVHNVETLAHVALIARHGALWFREAGSEDCPGTLLVTVPEPCARPGVYEVDGGTSLRDVLWGPAGGLAEGVSIKGLQVGGPAAGWISDTDVALEPAALHARGSSLGCCAIRILTSDRCGVDAVLESARFFAAESCGKCPPCRMETQYFARVLAGLCGDATVTEAQLYKALEIAELVAGAQATSCSLPSFPVAPLRSALDLFGADFRRHLDGAPCDLAHPERDRDNAA